MEFRIADTFTDSLARLTGEEQKATHELLDSSDWPIAQREIIKLLNQLCVRFGTFERKAE